jgi:hypothetical protein
VYEGRDNGAQVGPAAANTVNARAVGFACIRRKEMFLLRDVTDFVELVVGCYVRVRVLFLPASHRTHTDIVQAKLESVLCQVGPSSTPCRLLTCRQPLFQGP